MPRKSNLSRELIAQTAFEILRTEGYDALNARYLAQRLEISTMPLFHYFENMDEIKAEAVRLGAEKYISYMRAGMEEPIPFKGTGRAYIRFAKDEPRLFALFFMTADSKIKELPGKDPITPEACEIASDIMNGNTGDGSRLLKNMWLVVHGIAALEATGKMSFSDEEMSEILSETFVALKMKIEGESI